MGEPLERTMMWVGFQQTHPLGFSSGSRDPTHPIPSGSVLLTSRQNPGQSEWCGSKAGATTLLRSDGHLPLIGDLLALSS